MTNEQRKMIEYTMQEVVWYLIEDKDITMEQAMEGMYATEIDEKNITDVLTGKRRLEDVIEEIKQKYVESTEDSIE